MKVKEIKEVVKKMKVDKSSVDGVAIENEQEERIEHYQNEEHKEELMHDREEIDDDSLRVIFEEMLLYEIIDRAEQRQGDKMVKLGDEDDDEDSVDCLYVVNPAVNVDKIRTDIEMTQRQLALSTEENDKLCDNDVS